MFCGKCGCKLKEEDIFCPNCGIKIRGDEKTDGDQTQHTDHTQREQDQSQRNHKDQNTSHDSTGTQIKRHSGKEGQLLLYCLIGMLIVILIAAIGVGGYQLHKLGQQSDSEEAMGEELKVDQKDTGAGGSEDILPSETSVVTPIVTDTTTPWPTATPATAETQPPAPTYDSNASSDYIFPDSSTSYLTRSQIEALDGYTMYLARNEMYARHGRIFQNTDLQQYFGSKSWYTPLYQPEEFDAAQETIFNVYEKENIKLIKTIEDEKGYHY